MEKMLSKSKSRFFGRKKSNKNLGISSSDPPATEPERMASDGLAKPSTRPAPPTPTSRIVPGGGASATILNGFPSSMHHSHSGSSSMGSERPMGLHNHENPTSTFSGPSHYGSVSQSRFEVHISPTAFSPIVIPSSTPPESTATSPSKHRDISMPGMKCDVAAVEHTPRVGDGLTHGRSQSSVSPNETLNMRARSRRHGIPANFLESVGAVSNGMKTTAWNGQSLGAEQFIHSQALKDRSLPSQIALVHSSASAPVTSCLSNPDNSHIISELAPIHESSTDPAMFSSSISSGHTPIPRSMPSYNLAGITPTSSGVAQRRTTEVGHHPTQRSHRGALPQPPVSDASHHPQRRSPQSLSSSSPTGAHEATMIPHQSFNHHKTNPSVGSEMETGYKGLAFPLPPSSEEGLATSFSSSQSSLFSTMSVLRPGERPSTPKKTRDMKITGEYDLDAKLLGSTESRGVVPDSGRSARDRNASISVSENQASPIPNLGATRRKLDAATEAVEEEPCHMDGINMDRGCDTIRHQGRVASELKDVLGARPNQHELSDDIYLPTRVRAVSEAPRPHPTGARLHKHPELTKPLVLNPSRKTLHTMRSFTTVAERKQTQVSSSSRDLAGALNSADGRGERSRTITAIPMRVGPGVRRDRDGPAPVSVAQIQTQRSEDQSSNPPSFPLPTPPNSSSALSHLANEKKCTEGVPSRSHASIGMLPAEPLTLEEVTEALRAQRVRFDELSSHVLDVARRHTAEKDAYVGRVGRLEGTVAQLEREIHGLRWLVLQNTKTRAGVVAGASLILDTGATTPQEQSSESKKSGGGIEGITDKMLRRSSTMPQLPTLAEKPEHARNRRFGGLGLDFSPESTGSSPITLSSLATPSRYEVDMGIGEHTPSMDEIIDKLMAVRQWAGSDVRVSVVESSGEGGDSKRIVFREA